MWAPLLFFMMKVVLKIIKHCKEEENSLEPVNGQLVGLVQSSTNTLEVTNCFPLYVTEAETEDSGWLVQCGAHRGMRTVCGVVLPHAAKPVYIV